MRSAELDALAAAVGHPPPEESSFLNMLIEVAGAIAIPMCISSAEEAGEQSVHFVNSAFRELTGYTLEELEGRSLRVLDGKLTEADVKKRIHAFLSRAEPVTTFITSYNKSLHHAKHMLRIQPVLNRAGKHCLTISLQVDTEAHPEQVGELKRLSKLMPTVMDAVPHKAGARAWATYLARLGRGLRLRHRKAKSVQFHLNVAGETGERSTDSSNSTWAGVTEHEKAQFRELVADGSFSDAMQRSKINPSELVVGSVLGTGFYGEVRCGVLRGTPVALKRLHRHIVREGNRLARFKQECELCLSLRHPNIVQLIGNAWDVEKAMVLMVMELCSGGTLAALLQDVSRPLPWPTVRLPIAQGIARALSYLHGQTPAIVHRDLKCDNVLLSSDLTPKLSDFGLSRELSDKLMMSNVGTPIYTAPEILADAEYDESSDVWSFGCVLVCLTNRTTSPYDMRIVDAMGSLNKFRAAVQHRTITPLFVQDSEHAPDGLSRMCCRLRADERPTSIELIELLDCEYVARWASDRRVTFNTTASPTRDPSSLAPASADARLYVSGVFAGAPQAEARVGASRSPPPAAATAAVSPTIADKDSAADACVTRTAPAAAIPVSVTSTHTADVTTRQSHRNAEQPAGAAPAPKPPLQASSATTARQLDGDLNA